MGCHIPCGGNGSSLKQTVPWNRAINSPAWSVTRTVHVEIFRLRATSMAWAMEFDRFAVATYSPPLRIRLRPPHDLHRRQQRVVLEPQRNRDLVEVLDKVGKRRLAIGMRALPRLLTVAVDAAHNLVLLTVDTIVAVVRAKIPHAVLRLGKPGHVADLDAVQIHKVVDRTDVAVAGRASLLFPIKLRVVVGPVQPTAIEANEQVGGIGQPALRGRAGVDDSANNPGLVATTS